MSFDWADFLALAQALQSNPEVPGPQEAALRSAVSRAYYAAFHLAGEVARSEGWVPKGSGDDHKGLQRDLIHGPRSTRLHKSIATKLDRLYDHRRKADYSDTMRNPAFLAQAALQDAARILEELRALSTAGK
jgi:uncharacterized protein (UPF0332 family)